METVEVVIRIPKEKYKLLTEMGDCVLNHNERAIKHGTVLPKGHGALKDTSKILEKAWIYNTDTDSYSAVYTEDIINAPTVIEADKED